LVNSIVIIKAETVLSLRSVAPELHKVRSGLVAVPNTREIKDKLILIDSFIHKIGIQQSKHRPCKLEIQATDGQRYDFLLKGHEDLRQDQRVLQ
jgi:FKBP12-rapamycin complex-associated protein